MSRLNNICVVCGGKFSSSDIIQSSYCGHIFHKNCLDNWKLKKLSCPMCKREFPSGLFEIQLFLQLDDEEENAQENPKQSEQELKQIIENLKLSVQKLTVETEKKTKELDLKNRELEKEIANSTRLTLQKFELEGLTNIETDNYLLIEKFPKTLLTDPLENNIIIMGARMHLTVIPEDICKVRMLKDDEYQLTSSDMVGLLVEFKSNDMKIKFLASRDILKKYISRSFILKPIIDTCRFSLLVYANEKLGNCGGFKEIYIWYSDPPSSMWYIAVKYNDGNSFKVYKRKDVDDLLELYVQEMNFIALMAKRRINNKN